MHIHQHTDRHYYIAINNYRSSTSDGFGNTWACYECPTAAYQRQLLTRGLRVHDCEHISKDGRRSMVYSTRGIRLLTNTERSRISRERKWGIHPPMMS